MLYLVTKRPKPTWRYIINTTAVIVDAEELDYAGEHWFADHKDMMKTRVEKLEVGKVFSI